MFLIEYQKDIFIDAERINFINLSDNKVRFTHASDVDLVCTVDKGLEGSFLNNLQVVNASLANPQARHNQISKPSTKVKVNK
jgi:hypothetical protein